MGTTTSTMENDIESSVIKLFGNNVYDEEMPIPISSLECMENKSTAAMHAPEEICLTIVDSSPDHHFLHINNEYNYELDYMTVDTPKIQLQHNNVTNDDYNCTEYMASDIPVEIIKDNGVTSEENGGQTDHIKKYQLLYKAALKGDWLTAKRILKADSNAITAKITMNDETVLHVAAASRHSMFVEKLVKLVPLDSLALKNSEGETMLHVVAAAGIIRAAKVMVTKNPNLTQMPDASGWVPLVTAVYTANPLEEKSKKMVHYLCSVTRDEEPSPYSGVAGGSLISITIASNLYDVALNLVQQYPSLATEKNESGYSALEVMAARPSSFTSGSEATTWERFLRSFRVQIHEKDLMHTQALALVKCICKEISLKSSADIFKFFEDSHILEEATRFGAFYIVLECVQTFPDLLCVKMKTNNTILEEAIKYRRENMFNLICEMNAGKKLATSVDGNNNTILHLVAKRADPQQLNSVIGAALQMQRELQWYQEVENIVLQRHRQKKNNEGKTPRALFTEEHKDLLEKAEKWMKDTANSCMIVATLITTVVFAAVFTVPGGNVSDIASSKEGIPIFLNTTSFTVFAVADALALFSSITSVLMFFSILSSRYAEDDFLFSLPKKLITGFVTLFFSIAAMIVAFGAALSIVLEQRWAWAPIPIALFACIPVTLFALLQLPLFVTIVRSTYGTIFRRKDQHMQWAY